MSFLEINALAEDLRCIDAVPGINEVIRDLLSSELCKPTWHVIVGDNYGGFYTHEEEASIVFCMNDLWITVFKSALPNPGSNK